MREPRLHLADGAGNGAITERLALELAHDRSNELGPVGWKEAGGTGDDG
jgi:hypothetical protein